VVEPLSDKPSLPFHVFVFAAMHTVHKTGKATIKWRWVHGYVGPPVLINRIAQIGGIDGFGRLVGITSDFVLLLGRHL